MSSQAQEIIELSPKKFLWGCLFVSILIWVIGKINPLPGWVVALEVFLTIISLFILGSIKYRLDKNALTYGAGLIIVATFWESWWIKSNLKESIQTEGLSSLWHFFQHYFLTLHGLDKLFHADTMLFILGLTFFVAVVAQTRILETLSFNILKRYKGSVVPTVAALTAIVAFSSGILDGVSMIGLMIRTLVIILFLAKAQEESIIYAVIVSTIITTVCGMWLAYGEPPNLIMKANLHPHLDNAFFLRYCLPAAIGTYFLVYFSIRKKLKGKTVNLNTMDVLDIHTADVRFLQAMRHGEVLTAIEFTEEHVSQLGNHFSPIIQRLQKGEPFGEALVNENVPRNLRLELVGKFVDEKVATVLDEHYQSMAHHERDNTIGKISTLLDHVSVKRSYAQKIAWFSFIPFIGLLIAHAINHNIPLFLASFAGFFVALFGIYNIPKTKALAFREAIHEYKEYLFLFPLFLSITLLQKTGFFNVLSELLHSGIERIGVTLVAYIQFAAAAFLSALLDNNIVADFASRALHGLDIGVLHLFSMSQIAGYAAGGCWTHIGSAQSVLAYAFIQKEVNKNYTPFQWMKAITPLILSIFVLMFVVIVIEGLFFHQ
ncbi:MAG: SLC13 family permease [Elusimicrobiota bacterium]